MNSVAILLSTYNGEDYLIDQLNSLKHQKKVKITIFVIDDSSEDNTINVLENCNLDIKILRRKGMRNPSKNFIDLIRLVPLNYDYYSFCDQDDYWLKSKLSYSIFKIKLHKAEIVGSRSFIGNEKLKIFDISRKFYKPSFNNSVVQSIAGGNTLLWTNKYQRFLNGFHHPNVASHDWYLYQMSYLYDYKFYFILKPTIIYRQHQKNVVGSNLGIKNFIKRIQLGLRGQYQIWHTLNENHLIHDIDQKKINETNLEKAQYFYYFRNKNAFLRIFKIFFEYKFRRQLLIENILLFIALIIKKV